MNKKIKTGIFALTVAMLCCSCNNSPKTTERNEQVQQEATLKQGSIVYFQLDKVIANYDMALELKKSVEAKVAGIEQELTRRGNKLQAEFNSFSEKINNGLITRTTAELQGQKLQEKKLDFDNYTAEKQREIAEEQQTMLNEVGDAIKEFLRKYNDEKKYAMILSTQGDILPAPVVVGDTTLDITQDIIKKLNEEYVKNKTKNNSTNKK